MLLYSLKDSTSNQTLATSQNKDAEFNAHRVELMYLTFT